MKLEHHEAFHSEARRSFPVRRRVTLNSRESASMFSRAPRIGMRKKPPRYLADGDRMALSVAGLGEQHQTVRLDASLRRTEPRQG
jgi:hypothetical protein